MRRFLHRLAAPGTTIYEKIAKGLFWGIAMNPGGWLFVITHLCVR